MSSFPYKLHQLLTELENNDELSSIISWLPSGEGFRIHQPLAFENVLLKKYFPRQSKIKSFKRQVQYYGFENLGKGSYTHPCFVRGKRSLCGKIIHKLPMKAMDKTPTAAKKAAAKVVSRSPSPASTGMLNSLTVKMSPMPVFSANAKNLPMLDSGAFALSPVTRRELVVPEGQGLNRPVLHMLSQYSAGGTSMQYWNQLKNKNTAGIMPSHDFATTASLNLHHQQAMQEYLKLLYTR